MAKDLALLLLSSKDMGSMHQSAIKKLFYFFRTILKDKIVQIDALKNIEIDPFVNVEMQIDNLIDKPLKVFLKLTFRLFFDFTAYQELRKDS